MNLLNHLHIFNYVCDHGDKRQEKFHLDELVAWHDIDGYSCYLGYRDLTMSLYFHSQFSFDYENEETFKSFNSLIDDILKELKVG